MFCFLLCARNAALTSRRARSDEARCFAESVRLFRSASPSPCTWSDKTASSLWIRSHVCGCNRSLLLATKRKADAIVRCRLIHVRDACALIECSSMNAWIVLLRLVKQSSLIISRRCSSMCASGSSDTLHMNDMKYEECSRSSVLSICSASVVQRSSNRRCGAASARIRSIRCLNSRISWYRRWL